MEKKRSILLTPSKPAFIAALVFFFSTINARKMKTFKDHCGAFYESMAHLYKIKQAELDFYHFKAGQRLQVLAPNVVISKLRMQRQQTA